MAKLLTPEENLKAIIYSMMGASPSAAIFFDFIGWSEDKQLSVSMEGVEYEVTVQKREEGSSFRGA